MYRRVNFLFGDIVKVTPSSKVVGDMALYMVQNELDETSVIEQGHKLDFLNLWSLSLEAILVSQ